MKSIVPYTKEIRFDSKLAEICSISLEPELDINNTSVEGNFIISGEYKAHEVSVNKEEFTYKLPFSVDVTDNILKDSIEFEVTDFTYEILGDNILKVDIEFSVSAEEMALEEIEEEAEEEKEEEVNREAMIEEINDLLEETEENRENEKEIEIEKNILEEKEDAPIIEEKRLDQESADLILNSATDKEDEYTTYSIHLVKPGDTIESIIATYQTDLTILKQYNILENLNVGDKILIPSIDE